LLHPGWISEWSVNREHVIWDERWIGRKRVPFISGYRNLDGFRDKVYPLFLSRKKKELDGQMPTLSYKNLWLDMSAAQDKVYMMAEDGVLKGEDDADRKTALIDAQFIANMPSLREVECPSVKEEAFSELLEGDLKEEQVIVYCPFRTVIDKLFDFAVSKGFSCVKITGEVTSEVKREEARVSFVKGESQFIFINDAGGKSLNLQSATCIVFYSLPWCPGDYAQVVGRGERLFSTSERLLVIHLLVRESVDDHMFTVLDQKFKLVEAVYEGKGDLLTGSSVSLSDIQEAINLSRFSRRSG